MTAPFSDLLIVALEQAVAAPLCTSRFVEMGARVIKIERAEGDFARGYDQAADGDSSYFIWNNQGKESLVLDLKSEADCNLLYRILAKADVFVQNLGPGASERAGFGSSLLRERYPNLITCDISGYGAKEDAAGLKAYDFLVQAESGLIDVSGAPEALGRIGVSICDIGAGITAHAAILEALFYRERTGTAYGVDVSLFGVAAEWMNVPLIQHEYGGKTPKRVGLMHPSIQPYSAFEVSDGLIIIAIQNEREWMRFCNTVLRMPDMTEDPRFSTNSARVEHIDELHSIINSVSRKYTKASFCALLKKADIAFGALNSVEELGNHPALNRVRVKTTKGSDVTMAAPAIGRTLPFVKTRQAPPEIGANSEAIRTEFS